MPYHRWCGCLILVLACFECGAATAGTISLSTADPGAADASVWHGSKFDRNDGGNAQLMVSQGTRNGQLSFSSAKTYLRFNLAPLQGQSIADARLVLWSTNGNSISFPLLLYALNDLDNQWVEGTGTGTTADTTGISWENSPGRADTFSTFNDSTFLGNFSAMTGERTEAALSGGAISLVDLINSAIATDHESLTLMLSSALPDTTLFYRMPSAESADVDKAPTLIVTTATPEPSAFALAVPAALVLMWRFWRKRLQLQHS